MQTLNGRVKEPVKGRVKVVAVAGPVARKPVARKGRASGAGPSRRAITIALGCGIPGLSLALSSIGGRLLMAGHYGLGGTALVLCSVVLAVSLSHLAWAVRDVTGSSPWQSWCLAVAVDVSLVLGELSGVAGFSLWVVPVVMTSVTVASAVLNCWAFLGHKH